jgi:hypothetical protein
MAEGRWAAMRASTTKTGAHTRINGLARTGSGHTGGFGARKRAPRRGAEMQLLPGQRESTRRGPLLIKRKIAAQVALPGGPHKRVRAPQKAWAAQEKVRAPPECAL